MENNKQIFLEKISQSYDEGSFLKIKISKNTNKNSLLKNLTIKKVKIKNKYNLNFLYCNKTQDITKNYSLDEALDVLIEIIWVETKNAVLFTKNHDITLSYNKKMESQLVVSKSSIQKESLSALNNNSHNNNKSRFISLENNTYLQKLWIINASNWVNKNKTWKVRQIQKFIETLDSTIKKSTLKNNESIIITDMWSWKWYLTFAVYDYLQNILKKQAVVNWIEFRKDLVDICNNISKECKFANLKFLQWTIQKYNVDKNDILIALHACNTATDDAIYKWIVSDSEIIMLSPCCHKQIRKEISQDTILSDILQHWILKERQAEMT